MIHSYFNLLFCIWSLTILNFVETYAQELPSPVFERVILDDGKDLIFPTIIKASDHFNNPLGKYYLYTSPHRGANIQMYYSESVEGPWNFYGTVIDSKIGRSHHVSAPSAIWNEESNKLFIYVHAPNSTTIWTESTDGLNFKYGGVAVDRKDLSAKVGYECKAASYGRVYQYSLPNIGNRYAMSISAPSLGRGDSIKKNIAVATSDDGKKWEVRSGVILDDRSLSKEFQFLDAHYFSLNDKHFFIYSLRPRKNPQSSKVSLHISEVDENWENSKYLGIFYEGVSDYPDYNNARGNTYFQEGDQVYMIYEAGKKHHARLALARLEID